MNDIKRLYPNFVYLFLALMSILIILLWIATPHMWAASFAYTLMVAGFLLRRVSKKFHTVLMSSAMAIDLILVLLLEAQRDAIATAISFRLTPLQQAHIMVSTMAVLCYFPIIALGIIQLKKSSSATKRWHMRFGIAAFIFRTLGFFLMFSMLQMH